MKLPQTPVQSLLECPKCGKNTIVEFNDHRYQCISCDFYRDLSRRRQSNSDEGSGGLMAVLLIIIVLIAML